MALDIVIYLNDKDMTSKILSKFKPSEVLDLAKREVVSWVATNCGLETWKTLIKKWKSTDESKDLLEYLLPFLSNFMTEEDKDLGVAGYLLDEAATILIEKRLPTEKYVYAVLNQATQAYIEKICSFLKICSKMGNAAIGQKIFDHITSNPDTYTASFVADLLVKMREILGDNVHNYKDFNNHALNRIQTELDKLKNPKDCSFAFKHPCDC